MRDEQDVAALDRARLYVAGPVVDATTPEAARAQVAAVAALSRTGSRSASTTTSAPTKKMPPEVYRAVIDEAHKRGLRVAAHLFYLADAKDLLAAGVDLIAHSVRDAEIDAGVRRPMLERRGCASAPR